MGLTNLVELIGLTGLKSFGFMPGDSCGAALLELHNVHNMRIVATDTLKKSNTLVFTLVEDAMPVTKTALLGCRPVEVEEDDD